jgi:hypothetical protein
MDREFDGYYKWLGIPPAEQPPNHYRLLGLADFEPDFDVIEGAADRQMAHIRTFQAGPQSALSQRILSEISAARIRLLDRDRKAEYDRSLRTAKQRAAQSKPAAQPTITSTPPSSDAIVPPLLIKTEPRAVRRASKRAPALFAIAGCFVVAVALALYAAVASRGGASSNGHRGEQKHALAMAKHASQSQSLQEQSEPVGERTSEATATAKTGARHPAGTPTSAHAAAVIPPETTEATEKPHVAATEGTTEANRPAKPSERAATIAENVPAMAAAEEKAVSPGAATTVSTTPPLDEETSAAGASSAEPTDDQRHALAVQELDDMAAAVKARAASARSPDALESLAMEYWSLTSRAVELDDFESAGRFATSMIQVSRKTRDKGLQADLQIRAKQLKELRTAFNEAKPALTALRADAADVNASGTWGRYIAWLKGNWSDGLPLLARGEDDVAVIAARELRAESSAEAIVALADEWSQIAEHEKGTARRSLEDHACQWYERALPELPMNDQQAVRKKIERTFGDATVYELPDNGSGIQLGGAEVNIGEVATVEFWVCSQGRDAPLVTKRQTSDDQSLTFYLSGGHADVIGDGPFYRVDVWDPGSAEINDGRWHHVAAVKHGKALSLFVDGQLAGSGETLLSFRSESPWILGAHRPWNNSLGRGRFCRLRISTVARYHPSFTPGRTYARDQYTVWMP